MDKPEQRVPPAEGEFLHVPYDWRRPTLQRLKARLWNPDDSRIFTPKAFGWGWAINFHALLRKLGIKAGR